MSTRRGSNAAPAFPAAERMRPQFGSDPAMAVFTSGELAIAARDFLRRRIARRALHLDRHQLFRALAVADDLPRQRFQHLRQRIFKRCRADGRTPDAPFASTATISLVDVSPSTEIRL